MMWPKKSVKIKRSCLIFGLITFALGILWIRGFLFTEVFRTHKANEPNRQALLRIQEAIILGASHAEVLAAYWQHRTNDLKLSAERPARWSIAMPGEWGASDWYLLI